MVWWGCFYWVGMVYDRAYLGVLGELGWCHENKTEGKDLWRALMNPVVVVLSRSMVA